MENQNNVHEAPRIAEPPFRIVSELASDSERPISETSVGQSSLFGWRVPGLKHGPGYLDTRVPLNFVALKSTKS